MLSNQKANLENGVIEHRKEVAIGDKEIPEFISEVLGCSVRYDYTYDAQKRRFPRARIDRKIGDILKFTGGALKKDRHFPRIQKDLENKLNNAQNEKIWYIIYNFIKNG